MARKDFLKGLCQASRAIETFESFGRSSNSIVLTVAASLESSVRIDVLPGTIALLLNIFTRRRNSSFWVNQNGRLANIKVTNNCLLKAS
jgi:hypothetical protein